MAVSKPFEFDMADRVEALVAAGATEQDAYEMVADKTGRAPTAIRRAYLLAEPARLAACAVMLGLIVGVLRALGLAEGDLLGLWMLGAVLWVLIAALLVLWRLLPEKLRSLLATLGTGLAVVVFSLAAMAVVVVFFVSGFVHAPVITAFFIVALTLLSVAGFRAGAKWGGDGPARSGPPDAHRRG